MNRNRVMKMNRETKIPVMKMNPPTIPMRTIPMRTSRATRTNPATRTSRVMKKRSNSSIAFIGCSKSKASDPCMAWQMYQGSLFQKTLAYCLSHHDQVFILSAKYGLISTSQIIEPYDENLYKMSRIERIEWTQKIKEQIVEQGLTGEFWFYVSDKYCEFFEGHKQ